MASRFSSFLMGIILILLFVFMLALVMVPMDDEEI